MNHHPRSTDRPRRLPFWCEPLAHAVRVALLGAPLAAAAQATGKVELAPVVVTGNSTPPMTKVTEDIAAAPANVTVLGRKELDQKTVNTYGDIFRGLTGVYVNEYGQGLVAYEIKFRGFSSGHGRDVAAFLDGMPLNVTGSQHTNGYMDLAQLIPELVDRVEVVRGPFSVFAGNHAVAGSVQMFTDRGLASSLKASVDSFGRARVLPVFSTGLGTGNLLVALDATQGSGYTDQSDEKRANLFTRYSLPVAEGIAAFRFQAYHATAEAPGYLDDALVQSGRVDRRRALTKGIGDDKNQRNWVFNFRSDDAEGASGLRGGWTTSAYALHDRRQRFTNYDLTLPANSTVPVGGEQDRLHQAGGELRKVTSLQLGLMPSQLAVGAQYNREHIDALHFTADAEQNRLPPNAAMPDTVGVDRRVVTTTRAVFAQLQLQPLSVLKVTAGLRYDHLGFDVALHPQDDTYAAAVAAGLGATVKPSDARFSPKLGAALQVLDSGASTVELYGNYAQGLKSPYAFADFYSNLATSSSVPDLALSTLRSVELGAQGGRKDGAYHWRAGVWDTRQAKEGQLNDAGVFQAFGTTTRRGFDLEASVMVASATRFYGNYSGVRARSLTSPSGQNYLTNVPEWIGALGVQAGVAQGPHHVDLSLEDSIVGPQSVTADNALRGRTYNRLTGRAAYTNPSFKGATGFLNLVAYDRQYEETRFDFGGGVVGISPRPRFQATVGVQFPITF